LSVFIDTGFFVAARNAADKNHSRGKELVARALAGGFGVVYTSDYVIDEAITTALARTRRLELAIDIGEFILGSPRIVKLSLRGRLPGCVGEVQVSGGKAPELHGLHLPCAHGEEWQRALRASTPVLMGW
jgi:hypothetical protein